MADVFISYHEKSSGELVEKIANTLEGMGVSCWYAKRNLPPGGKFADYIPKEIRSCKVFLLVLNEHSNHSEHVKSETNLAFRRVNKQEQITLVPFKVDNCILDDDVDYYLSRFHITDGSPADAQSIQKLAKQISRILASEAPRIPEDSKTTESQSTIPRTKFVFLGCVICMVILLVWVISRLIPPPPPVEWWTLEGNHLLIHCTGDMPDYGPAEYSPDNAAPWSESRTQISALQIADSVTGIGSYAFEHCPSLGGVIIPDTVTYIGEGAFSDCTGLISIHISNNATDIGDKAFQGCTSLPVVYIPDSVTDIGHGAFADCASLKAVSVPETTEVASDAFPNPDIMEIRPVGDSTWKMEPEELWGIEPEELWKIQHEQ